MSIEVTVTFEGRAYCIHAFADDHITRQLQTGRFYEADLLLAIRDLQLEGTYIDVGAFIGTHSVFFAQECRATQVIAIEPNPEAFELLKQNLDSYGTTDEGGSLAIAYRAAVHASWRYAKLVHRDPQNRGMATVQESTDAKNPECGIITLDALGVPPVLLKIDVEGLELAVLESGARTIVTHRPVIVAEAATPAHRTAIDEYLKPLGYRSFGPYARTPTYLWIPPTPPSA